MISIEHNLGGNVVATIQIPTTALHTITSHDVKVIIDYGGKESRDPRYAEPPKRIELVTSEADLINFARTLTSVLGR